MKYTCLIVDDEPDAHVVLKHYCEKHGKIEVVKQCFNATDAIDYFGTANVDFIFLDINMPEISGFGLLSIIKQQPKIIFTTAYAEYALKSFEHNAIDYLLKPIKWERFKTAIDKLHNNSKTVKQLPDHINFEGLQEDITPTDIIYAASLGNYVKLYFKNKTVVIHATMLSVNEKLSNYGFIRIHKQYIVQQTLIKYKDGERIHLINNIQLPVGISYRQMIAALLIDNSDKML